jgi:hypothetical protein
VTNCGWSTAARIVTGPTVTLPPNTVHRIGVIPHQRHQVQLAQFAAH